MDKLRTYQKLKNVIISASLLCLAVAMLAFGSGASMVAAQAPNSTRMQEFVAAAQEFGVPLNVLLGVSYNESHWQAPAGPSVDNGYGLMDLRTQPSVTISGRTGAPVANPGKEPAAYYTLDEAAQLLHVSAKTLETDDQQNIRGGAAVLAQDARQLNNGQVPSSPSDWYSAIAAFSGSSDATTANAFASDVFGLLKSGVSATTPDGQVLSLAADPGLQPNTTSMSALNLKAGPMSATGPTGQPAECPRTLNCRFIPAAYAQDDPNDPTNYGNYDPANRPKDMAINYIFIHDTEGSYDSAISHFQDPTAYASAQYVVRSSDGAVTQMVTNEDVSWGVFDWYDNMHGINIENEGLAAQGASWYTPAMYQTDATLVRWLAAKYHIPLDRQHILGHDNIPVLEGSNFPLQHWDPGPFWNWTYFMDLVRGESQAQAAADSAGATPTVLSPALKAGDVVTIAPTFATNQPPVTDCQTGTCETLPPQGTSFVYLRTQPDNNAPLLSDPYLHPDSSPGTTEDSDWGDKAPSGFQYVVAGVQGDWTAIWYAGQEAWFYNPAGQGHTAVRSPSLKLVPKQGLASIPVYGAAYPEASAYPAAIPVQQFGVLYTIPAGQSYTTTGQDLPTDYYYDATVNYSLPDDHDIVHGTQKYYQITVNHRIGYVKAGDVTVR